MVIYFMGPPRAKNAAHTSRSILFVTRDLLRSSMLDVLHDNGESTQSKKKVHDSDTESCNGSGSTFIPQRRKSYMDSVDDAFDMEFFDEIRRQKELIKRDFEAQMEELMLTQKEKSATLGQSYSPVSMIRLYSPWKTSRVSPNHWMYQTVSHIHESPQSLELTPRRNDLFYASERNLNNGSAFLRQDAKNRKFLVLLSSTLGSSVLALSWDETEARHLVLLQEKFFFRRYRSLEIASYLSLQRSIRANAEFHVSKLSSLSSIWKKEKRFLQERMDDRARQRKTDHQIFMRSLPSERLPPLKLPSVTASMNPFKCNIVDYEVARAIAVGKGMENVGSEKGIRSPLFF